MISILGRVRLENSSRSINHDCRYKVVNAGKLFTDSFDQIFPLAADKYPSDEVQSDYKKLWDSYVAESKGLDLYDNFTTIFEISKKYQWCLPASTRKEEMPDVSRFHSSSGDVENVTESEIRDRKSQKYLLFCGDISGIQKFIYQVSSRGAYRTLKGRSFYIQILAELLSRQIVEECGLTMTNVLYASGGKFYLLMPNTNCMSAQDSKNFPERI